MHVRHGYFLIALFTAGCGGGGDPPPLTTAAVEETLTRAYADAISYTVRAPDSRGDCETQFTRRPSGTTVFEGAARERVSETWISKCNGETLNIVSRDLYLSRDPLQLYGAQSVGQANPGYSVHTDIARLPVTAAVGESGVLFTGTRYSDSSKTNAVASLAAQWSVEAGDGKFVWVCARVTTHFSGDRLPSSQTDCFGINALAQIVRYRVILDVPIAGRTVLDS